MKKKIVVLYIFLIVGILMMLSGTILTVYSFKHEVLDEKYIVKEVTNFTSSKKELKQGEVNVSKDVDYISKGIYKIIYKINYNREDIDLLFSNKSNFSITDVFGDSYKLAKDEILINKDAVKLYNYNTVTSDYKLSYNDNTFEIFFPIEKIENYKTITIYIQLKDREVNKKYYTSKESYYSFVPNITNDFYTKKTMQSYIIDGNGYILLENK